VITAPAPTPPPLIRARLILRERRREAARWSRMRLADALRLAGQRIDPIPDPFGTIRWRRTTRARPPKLGDTMTFPDTNLRFLFTEAGWQQWRWHRYTADPASGAGNCKCGAAERHKRHPHLPMPMASNPLSCTCGVLVDNHDDLLANTAAYQLNRL
jgi:hypothetical protein